MPPCPTLDYSNVATVLIKIPSFPIEKPFHLLICVKNKSLWQSFPSNYCQISEINLPKDFYVLNSIVRGLYLLSALKQITVQMHMAERRKENRRSVNVFET